MKEDRMPNATWSQYPIVFIVGSDWHFDLYPNYPDMFLHLQEALREATALAKTHKAARLILNGDTTNPLHGMWRNSLVDRVFNEFQNVAQELESVDGSTIVNLGNHGRGDRGTTDHVEAPFGGIPRVTLVREPWVERVQSRSADLACYNFFIPYQDSKDEFIAIVRGFAKSAAKLRAKGSVCAIFTHQWFRGQTCGEEEPAWDPSEESCWTLPQDLLAPFHVNFNGHLHRHQESAIAGTSSVVIGAPIQHNLGDRGQKRGILIVGVNSSGVTYHQHVFSQFPVFDKIKVTKETLKSFSKKDWSNTYLKVIVDDVNIARNDKALAGFNAKCMLPAEWALPPVEHDRLGGLTTESSKSDLLTAAHEAMFHDLEAAEKAELLSIELSILKQCKSLLKKEEEFEMPGGDAGGTVTFHTLSGQNIGPYKEFLLPLDQVGVTVITAPNSSGKTSLMDSFRFTIFGTVDGDVNSIVNDSAGKDCLGETSFTFGGEVFNIKRPRKHSTRKDVSFGSKTRPYLEGVDTDRKIARVLGLTSDTFDQLVTIKSVLPFASTQNAARRKMLEEVLEMQEWDIPYNQTTFLLNEESKKMAVLQSSESSLLGLHGRSLEHLATLKARSARHEAERTQTLEALRLQRRECKERILALDSKKDPRLDELADKQETLRVGLSRLEEVDLDKYKELRELKDDAQNKENKLSHLLFSARKERDSIKESLGHYKSLDYLVGNSCPTCGHKITAEHAESCQKEFQSKKNAELDVVRSTIVTLKDSWSVINTALEKLKVRIEAMRATKQARADKEEQLSKVREELLKVSAQAQQHHGRVKSLEAQDAQLFERIKEAKSGEDPYTDQILEESKSIEALIEKKKKTDTDIQDCSTQIFRLRKVKQVFSREGIRNLLLDQFVSDLSQKAGDYLTELSGGKTQIEFSTQKLNKDGSVREEFTMNIFQRGKGRAYKRISSGDRRRVDLAIMLALNDLLKLRRHRAYNLLWLDEVADPLDEEGCKNLAVLLKKKAAEGKMTILLVTFNPVLANLFSKRIHVIMDSTGTAHLKHDSVGV